jgi:hypothetical protein
MKKTLRAILFALIFTSCTINQSQPFIFKRFNSETFGIEYYKTYLHAPSQIEKINTDSCLIQDEHGQPVWSPNGKYYGCLSMYERALIIYDIDKNKIVTELDKRSPKDLQSWWISGWSPNSQYVGILSPGWLENPEYVFSIMKYDGTEFQQIHKSSSPLIFNDWSPNGKYLILEEFSNGMNGSSLIVIFDQFGREVASFDLLKITNTIARGTVDIKWSPDSKKLAFSTLYNVDLHNNNLYILNVESGEVTNILHDESLCPMGISGWSSDGQIILFNAIDCKNHTSMDFSDEIYYSLNIDGSELSQLTQKGDGLLNWSPDGKSIIVSGYGNGSSDKGIYIMDATGNNKRILLDNGYFVSWMLP